MHFQNGDPWAEGYASAGLFSRGVGVCLMGVARQGHGFRCGIEAGVQGWESRSLKMLGGVFGGEC